tara:strand:+ start:2310 stop:2504 length:195 start_codon:yes stop_codon:yes gene_type:complete
MPEDENTESMMDSTPLTGVHTPLLELMTDGRQRAKRMLSAGWQLWGVPAPLADLTASFQTGTFR